MLFPFIVVVQKHLKHRDRLEIFVHTQFYPPPKKKKKHHVNSREEKINNYVFWMICF